MIPSITPRDSNNPHLWSCLQQMPTECSVYPAFIRPSIYLGESLVSKSSRPLLMCMPYPVTFSDTAVFFSRPGAALCDARTLIGRATNLMRYRFSRSSGVPWTSCRHYFRIVLLLSWQYVSNNLFASRLPKNRCYFPLRWGHISFAPRHLAIMCA